MADHVALATLEDALAEQKSSIEDAELAGVSKATLDNLVELATLRAFSALEQFLETLFYLAMVGDSSIAANRSRLPVVSTAEVDLLVRGGPDRTKPYLDWLPFDRTLSIAEHYLINGAPFSWLKYRPVELRAMKELTVLRNEVAHGSDQAHEKFVRLASERKYAVTRAADYLRSTRGGDSEVQILLTQAQVIAQALVSADEVAASVMLQPEEVFQAERGPAAPVGVYECVRCGQGWIQRDYAKIPRCPVCDFPRDCPSCGRREPAVSAWARIVR